MNNRARAEHSEFQRQDWISHAYSPIEEADKKVGSELENVINPIFSWELDEPPKDATTKARWQKLTLEEHELLRPVFRLATQFLESAPSSDAICSVVYGDRHPSPEKIVFKGVSVAEFRKLNLPPSDVRETAAKVLKRLAGSIRFIVNKIEHPLTDENGAHGRTSGITGGFPDGVAVTDRPQLRGLAPVVTLDSKYVKMLKELLVETLGKQFQILKLHFEFAITICHEVIHAINLALSSDLLNHFLTVGKDLKKVAFSEPFYQGQNVAELGFFWENHVFGGAFIQSMPIRENPVFFGDWPSWMFRDEQEQPERALPKRRALKWLVSAYYIKNIQTREFWNTINVEHPHDLLALRIRKRVAVKMFMPSHFTDFDQTWDPNAPENQLGDFLRVPFTDDDPSPGARLANETHREREERLDRERQMLSPGRDLDYLNRIDPF